jgi:FtsP/CotA-like multicopper oxidase with cupredoxin domain
MRSMDTTHDSTRPQRSLPAGTAAAVVAVLAMVFAVVALVVRDSDDSDVATGNTTTVDLSEFAIEPAALQVLEGGSMAVTNTGSTTHDLTVRDAGLTTGEIAAGETTDLDLSSLAPGDYELLCSIPGHADAGMTATLTIGDAATGPGAGSGDQGDAASGGSHAQHMTEADYQRMDEAMQSSIAEFPAETEGAGNELLEPAVLPDGTREFELTAEITPWEVAPGEVVDAWTYNGMVPGPSIHLEVGDKVRIVLHNELPMGTDLHVHGINVPNAMDGVSPISQPLIESGESFSYEFTTDEVAVAMYHAHHHGQMQVPNGLFGTVFVGDVPLPRGQTIGGEAIPADLRVAQDLPLVLNDAGVIGYSLNGKSFPATAPIVAEQGDWILVHYFNEGTQIHPMHLHQFDQVVVAKDGFTLDASYLADTLNVAPGERYSVLVHLDAPGTWVWHCHILTHVERDTGMFGMVTALVVE